MSEERQFQKYRPSNWSEGDWFINKWCRNCIHGKYEHTHKSEDPPCKILSYSIVYELNDKEYPSEWVFGDDGKPKCTAWKNWDWGYDDDGNIIDPPPNFPDDPNQLCLPFIFNELENKHNEKESANQHRCLS